MDKIQSFVSVFSSANLRCFMIVLIFENKHKVVGDINFLNLLVLPVLSRFSESRSSSGSTPSVRLSIRLSVRLSVRNTFGVPSLCNL